MPQKFTQRAESNDQHNVAELGNKRGGGYRRGACRYRAAHLSADLILAVRTHDSFPSSGLSPPYLENVSFWPTSTNGVAAGHGRFRPCREIVRRSFPDRQLSDCGPSVAGVPL